MKPWLIAGFVLVYQLTVAQKITISGTVLDWETHEPLPYASIGIKDKSIGTISNAEGGFDFHMPQEYRNEILVVRMLGYKNFEAPIWSILADEVIFIEMTRSTTVLDEVVVTERYTGGDILRLAIDRVERNYAMRPFLLDGFYRDIKKVAGTNIALLEAAVKIYDEDYVMPRNNKKLRERVKLIEVRKSLGYDSKFTPYFGQVNYLEDLLLQNAIRYGQVDTREEICAEVVRLDDSFHNNREVFVIEYNRDYLMRFFVDKKNFAIVHLEYETGPSSKALERKNGLICYQVHLKKSMDFREVNGKMYLSFMNMNSKFAWHDAQTNALKFETELLQQLLINEIAPNAPAPIKQAEKMRTYSLQYQDMPYNKMFWENYNVIKHTPLDQKIIEDLEKAGPLQKQFEGKKSANQSQF
jgi:hypothetical protein